LEGIASEDIAKSLISERHIVSVPKSYDMIEGILLGRCNALVGPQHLLSESISERLATGETRRREEIVTLAIHISWLQGEMMLDGRMLIIGSSKLF
jgi:hypothetical protein